MTTLSAEQVKALAPDAASLKAGQSLADARHWPSLGRSEALLWGECKGSGKEPYKVCAELTEISYTCSCPSHKFPCKHVLAIMLLAATAPAKLKESQPPAWVAAWVDKRAARKQNSAKSATPKTDDATRQKDAAKRAARREKLAETGIETLERWLDDFARLGLASAQSASKTFWDEQAARLVDSQLPGAARLVREMALLPGSRPDWAEVLLLRLARLHLLTRAYRKLDALPEATRHDVRALLGWNTNQDELQASAPAIADDWLVLSSHTEEDEKSGLRTQTVWLWGREAGRSAQLLNFAHRSQPLDASLLPGLALRGGLVYFPGAYPLRAVLRDKQAAQQNFIPGGFADLASFQDAYADALGVNPWLELFPAVLENLTPLRAGETWLARDRAGQALPFSSQFTAPWELFSLAGGHPIKLFGTWDGFVFTPLAAWSANRCINF